MTQREKNLVKMFKAVLSACDEHPQVWTPLQAFSQNRQLLQAAITSLDQLICVHKNTGAGTTLAKNLVYKSAVKKALLIVGAIKVFADTTGNPVLEEQVNLNARSFNTGGSRTSVDLITRIIDTANQYNSQLVPFGVSQLQIDELTLLRDQLDQALGSIRSMIVLKKTYAEECTEKIRGIKAILTKRLDKLVELLQADHPEFCKQYMNAREVISYKGKKNNFSNGGNIPQLPQPPQLPGNLSIPR